MASYRAPGPEETQSLFAGASRGYDSVSAILGLGQYGRWHRALVDAAKAAGVGDGSRVLDVATGTGLLASRLQRRTGAAVTGLDLTSDMLLRARSRSEVNGFSRRLVNGSADVLPFADASFDALTFSYLYRYVDDPEHTTHELLRVVKPGGFIGFVEFHVPPNPVARAAWRTYTRIGLPVAGFFIHSGWLRVNTFLGANIDRFYREWDVARLTAMWETCGIKDVRARAMSLGGGLVMSGRKEAA